MEAPAAEALTASTFPAHARQLAERDPPLHQVVDAYGIPPFWQRPASFATLVLFIIEQQVSLASAKATFDRVRERLGSVTPDRLAAVGARELAAAGVSRQKESYLRALAEAALEGSFDIDELQHRSDAEARDALMGVVGVGPWTADVYLLSALRRPDVWPAGDRALQVGVAEVLDLPEVPDAARTEQIGERWRPLRSVAARLVWHAYLCRRGRHEPMLDGLDP